MRVIITGAAGHLGRLVAQEVLTRLAPEQVVLVTRRPSALTEFHELGAEVRYGDFDDPDSLEDAFAGGTRMLLISTDAVGRRVPQHRAAIDAATRAGVGQIVFTSIVNPVPWNPTGAHASEQGTTELILRRAGPAWTILRFGCFAELQIPPAATAVQNRRLIVNFGSGRIAPISRKDCAEAAAVILATHDHAGQTYDITGSERLSQDDIAALYTQLGGRRVFSVHLSDAGLAAVLAAVGTPAPAVWEITAYGRAVRHGCFDVVDPAFALLTGHPPMGLREVLSAHRADLLGVA
jgi:NAD(P)H dehydrogenase (quinone)